MDNEEIQETALQAISEIPFVGYQYIDSIINLIGSLTMTLLGTDRYSATRQAFNFWSNLAKEELRQASFGSSRNIIGSCLESLVQIILTGLEITELTQDDSEIED
jgi:hypothetical protein